MQKIKKIQRYNFGKIPKVMEIPHLLDIQRKSFEWFLKEGVKEALRDISPIEDFTGAMSLSFDSYAFEDINASADECKMQDMTYSAPLKVLAVFVNKETGEKKEQEVFMGDFPMMTDKGTFIINGTERVVVSQLVRSPGVYYDSDIDKKTEKDIYLCKVIPTRGSWIELETDKKNIAYVRIDRRRKFLLTIFLKSIGFGNNDELVSLFSPYDKADCIKNTVDKDITETEEEALIEIYKKLRPGEPPTIDSAKNLIYSLFFDPKRYDMGKVGRYKTNQKFSEDIVEEEMFTELVSSLKDSVSVIKFEKDSDEKIKIMKKSVEDFSQAHISESDEKNLEVAARIKEDLNVITDLKNAINSLKDYINETEPAANSDEFIAAIRKIGSDITSMRPFLLENDFMKLLNEDAESLNTLNQKDEEVKKLKGILNGEKESFEKIAHVWELVLKIYKNVYSRLAEISIKMNIESSNEMIINPKDIFRILKYLVQLMNNVGEIDDIDHFGNRRIKNIGELIQNQVRIGLARLERVVKERMTTQDSETITPKTLINIRPLVASLKEFFGSGQLSQFLDQTNPLAEITHKRRLSALGPGGLSRERAGFEVRDVHSSHYGRMCPIETPEGPNIGLIGSLATYAVLNPYGFIESPYLKVKDGKLTNEVEYLSADKEENFVIAQATANVDNKGNFTEKKLLSTTGGEVIAAETKAIDYMDVSPKQIFSAATSLIPFLEHDDANRALMGSNMQRQAVPLISPEAPLVGTGMEKKIARDSGHIILAEDEGEVKRVSSGVVEVKYRNLGYKKYNLYKFKRSNQGTCINQRPVVDEGQKLSKGDIIADGPSIQAGELALGRNLLVAFMAWEGYNYEDAIIISEKLVKEDILSSIHISKQEIEARQTKLGPEEITRDIPNVSDEMLKNLDERGIIRIGAYVKPGDILVGKITPKGETELTAEEKLLRAIFGEKAREVRDSSLKVPHGEEGIILDVQVFSRKDGQDLPPGVNELVRVFIAKKRKISVGDKLAGRHGNKGIISVILPEEDMPYMADGTPVDIIFNPLGVPSRMNVGQVLETHLGWAASKGWNGTDVPRNEDGSIHCACPIFDSASEDAIINLLKKADLPEDGKTALFDGLSGEKISDKITVGYAYVMKLLHLVDDKIHARSTGPYSLVTQQPLGGKAQFGGQRFGEMEVWALEAYGAAYLLQEMLTIKSDDVVGRVKTYESIVKGENIEKPGIPESFKVLVKEMQSLGLDVEVLSEEGKEVKVETEQDEIMKTVEELGIDLIGHEALNLDFDQEEQESEEENYYGDDEDEFMDEHNFTVDGEIPAELDDYDRPEVSPKQNKKSASSKGSTALSDEEAINKVLDAKPAKVAGSEKADEAVLNDDNTDTGDLSQQEKVLEKPKKRRSVKAGAEIKSTRAKKEKK
ncbi:MAG: DNA-directed RNA polymerase subunit beta [Actinobacteria bacterium]|nr:DNA-directed RNA polymerase subunit beta [Actinomycetota bacterium]